MISLKTARNSSGYKFIIPPSSRCQLYLRMTKNREVYLSKSSVLVIKLQAFPQPNHRSTVPHSVQQSHRFLVPCVIQFGCRSECFALAGSPEESLENASIN